MPLARHLLLLAMIWLLAGCAALAPSTPAPPPGSFLAPASPRPLAPDELASRLQAARVVLVGETHDHPGHHAIQLQVLEIMAQAPGHLVVGVEWLDSTAQPACDGLSSGRLTVEEFAKAVDWRDKWGYPLEMYAPILEFARARRLPLVALNAPMEVVRQVARQGLASLGARERGQLAPALDLDDQAYRQMIGAQFQAHGVADGPAADNFFAAQVARDETMAHRLAQALHPWPDGGRRGLVLAGAGHLSHGLGLPARLDRRLPGLKLLTVLPVPPQALGDLGEMGPRAWPADLLAISTPAPPRPPRLGVILKERPEGLLVERVLPGSPAQRGGIKDGDLLLEVDGRPLKQVKDIHDLIRTAPFAPHAFLLGRGQERPRVTITLAPPNP